MICTGNSKLKCKAEAHAPGLHEFVSEFRKFAKSIREEKRILVVTDDRSIRREISLFSDELDFVEPEPAPERILDKVILISFFSIF